MFLFFLAVIMIYSSHSVDTKIYKLNDLSKKVVMVENEFIEKRKEIVKIKMESNIKIQLSERGIAPSLNPPTKIVITKEIDKETIITNIVSSSLSIAGT